MAESIERAKKMFINRRFDEAIEEYDRALRELPEDQLFVAYSNRGAALMNKGKVKEAVKCFRKAIELNPEHYESLHNMGVAFAAQKQYERALECFDRTIEYAPFFYASHCGKSEALSSLGRYAEAIDAAKDGISEDPNESIAHADLGFAYLKQGRFEEAVKAYDRAHALGDKSAETARLHAIALCEAGLACEKANDIPNAIHLYERSIEKQETPLAYHNLGILFARERQVSKAKSTFSKALKLDPGFFATNAALGIMHAKEGNNDLAIPFLAKAYEMNPKHLDNLYNLALCHMKEGNKEDAVQFFRILIKSDPANEDALLAIQLLKTPGALNATVPSTSTSSSSSSRKVSSANGSSSHHRSASTSSKPRAVSSSSRAPSSSSSSRRERDKSVSSSTSKKRSASKHRKLKFFTWEELQRKPCPAGVDTHNKEQHLTDQDFLEIFGVTKQEFWELPTWKQTLEKKRYNLF